MFERRCAATVLLLLFCLVAKVYSAHFRGAVIMVKPKPGGAHREMDIFYHISWRRSASKHFCDSTSVSNGNILAGEAALECEYGCSGNILNKMSYVCTCYNATDDWTFGEYQLTHTFSNVTDAVTIGTSSNAWIAAVSDSRWNVSTTFSLVTRADTGQINSSPRVITTPLLHLQEGCSYTIPLAVSDPDNDIVGCRWAVGNECSSVCDKFPGATLDSSSCTIRYTANRGTGLKVVAIMIEDFAPGSPYHPLSSVALQFLVSVVPLTQSCSRPLVYYGQPSVTLHPSPKTVLLSFNNSVNITLTCATSGTPSYYWERQNGNIPLGAIGVNTNTLILVNVRIEDAGNYRCVAYYYCDVYNSRSFSKFASVFINVPVPVIMLQPSPMHIDLKKTAMFTCNAIGFHVQYEWIIGFGSFPSKVTGINSSTLVIPDVRSSDANTYTCVVSNKGGSVSSNAANLTVTGLPMVRVVPSSQSVEITHSAIFTADVSGVGSFKYQWKMGNHNLAHETGSTYLIRSVSKQNEGYYSCVVTNTHGDHAFSKKAKLHVTMAPLPVLIKQPNSTVVQVYHTARFECVALTHGFASITWKRLNSELPVTANITSDTSPNKIRSVLTIDNMIGYYQGLYYCVIENSAGMVNSTFAHCNVTVPSPEVIIPPAPIKVRPSENVTFSCLAWSYGGIVYKWTKNDDSALPSNSRILSQDKSLPADVGCLTTVNELTIFHVQVLEEGRYCCVVSNKYGNVTECAWLEVDTSPIITEQPSSVTVKYRERNYVALMIVANGMGLIHYCWQKLDIITNQWAAPSVRVVNSTSPNLTFSRVLREDAGTYRCIVENDDGTVISDNATITIREVDRCLPLSDPDNGKVFVITDGETAIFTCNNGFVTTGNSSLQCINGTWSSPPPKCQPR